MPKRRMASNEQDGIPQRRLSRDQWAPAIVLAASAVLLVLVSRGYVSLVAAVCGLLAVAVAVLTGARRPAAPLAPPSTVAEATGSVTSDVDGVISGFPAPAILLDRNGIVLAFNRRAAAVAPTMRRGEPASLSLRMPEVVDAIRRAVATGEAQSAEYSERVPVDRWFEAHVIPLQSAQAVVRPPTMLLTLNDLTPLRRVEEMRADFVANASHELRTPLASLSGFIDTLKGPARDDAAARAKFLDIMQGQARRMARLIDDLLSLSRVELSAHIAPEFPVDLAPVVRQVADNLQMLAREREVEIAITAPAEPLLVLGERDELLRVFENLIENALKYGGGGKRVDIRLARDGANAAVAVRDYGPGIPAEHVPRLTERFYRVDVGLSRAEGGTGLGLALVKHVLARHRGRLAIESALGAGSTFTALIPLHTAGEGQ